MNNELTDLKATSTGTSDTQVAATQGKSANPVVPYQEMAGEVEAPQFNEASVRGESNNDFMDYSNNEVTTNLETVEMELMSDDEMEKEDNIKKRKRMFSPEQEMLKYPNSPTMPEGKKTYELSSTIDRKFLWIERNASWHGQNIEDRPKVGKQLDYRLW